VELIFSSENGGELQEGVFENTFVKQDSAWKIQSVHFYPRMIVDAATGWAKSAKPAPGPSKEFPPDRAPTASYGIYPKFSVVPFHFDNPVTGKPPQYPEGVTPSPRAAAAKPSPNTVVIRNAADLEARLTDVERAVSGAEVYDAAENLTNAYGYSLDDSPGTDGGLTFVSHVLQPVIEVPADGKSAKVRARRLELGGTSGAAGYWSATTFEGQIVAEKGTRKLQVTRSVKEWSAPYPGGWGKQ
jgi:hypothetical protein